MTNSLAKKIFAVGTVAATVVMSAVPFAAFAAAHAPGTNVKSSDGTIWMITQDGTQRRPYTSAGAFLSYGFNSFSSVVAANADDLALPAGSFIAPQDGKIICSDRGADKGTCYLITMGMKAAFTSASVFTGRGFSFSRSTKGDVSWMSSAANISDTTSPSPAGTLINNMGTIMLVGTNGTMGIPSVSVFNSWGYSFADTVPANAADKAMPMSGGVMTARVPGQLSPVGVANGTPTPTVTGPISASLAYDNPASGTVVKGTTGNVLAKFVFSGNGAVTGITLKRVGVSADTTLSNVYLYDGNTRLTDAASVNTGSVINFSNAAGLFSVSGSRTISVKADIDSNATAGQTAGVQLTSIMSGSNTTSFSITGNTFTVASVSDLATVDFATATPSGGTVDPAKDVTVFQSNVSVGSRNVVFGAFTMRQIGSVNNGDIANYRLIVDGKTVATAASADSNGYVNFSFTAPVTLQTGTRVLRILADVNGGSSRTFQFSVRNKADVSFMDSNYGAYVSPTYNSSTFPAGPASAVSISSGSITVAKATNSLSGNVTNNTSDVSLGTFTVTAYGEPVKLETIKAAFTGPTAVGSLRNGRILINGAQYGSTATLNATTTGGTSYTLNYTVNPGSPVTLELRADMFDNDGTNSLSANDSITGVLMTGSNNAQKLVSLGYTNAPTATSSANALTVVSGSLSLVKNANYANQTTPAPQTGYKIASYNLTGSSSENINIDQVGVTVAASGGSTFDYNDLTDVVVKVNGSNFGSIKSTLSSGENTFSGSFSLAKNTTVTVEVFATINSAAITNADSALTSAKAYGTTSSSSASVNSGTVNGQTVTVNSGSLSASLATTPLTPAQVVGGTTKNVAMFDFYASNDSFTITELTATTTNATTIASVNLLDCGTTGASCSSTPIATKPGATSTTFTGLSIAVPSNSHQYLGIQLVLGNVGSGAGTSGENVKVTLTQHKASSSNGVSTTTTDDLRGGDIIVFKSIPTISTVALPSTLLTGGSQTLFKFTVGANGNTIAWNKINFTVSTSTSITPSSFGLYDSSTGLAVGGNFTSATTTSTGLTVAFTPTAEEVISSSKTYELRATISGTISTGSYVSTFITQGATSATAPNTYAAVNGAQTGKFVWSDRSAATHSTSSSDWNDDYLVSGLPTNSGNLTK